MQALDLVERNIGPGRIVGVGQEHDLGARRYAREDRVDVGGEIRLRRDDRLRAGAERGEQRFVFRHAKLNAVSLALGQIIFGFPVGSFNQNRREIRVPIALSILKPCRPKTETRCNKFIPPPQPNSNMRISGRREGTDR